MDNADNIILSTETHEYFMLEAIKAAQIALEAGDVPIGAVIVKDGRIIARGWNQREQLQDPTAHAEMIALTQASEHVGSWRLYGCTMYVTLEPCTMCAGALILSRIDRVVFACPDPKTGAAGSLYNIFEDPRHNHRVEVQTGVLEEPCSMMLSDFFKIRRKQIAEEKNSV
jgi:tRNA(adenine34) deaminase